MPIHWYEWDMDLHVSPSWPPPPATSLPITWQIFIIIGEISPSRVSLTVSDQSPTQSLFTMSFLCPLPSLLHPLLYLDRTVCHGALGCYQFKYQTSSMGQPEWEAELWRAAALGPEHGLWHNWSALTDAFPHGPPTSAFCLKSDCISQYLLKFSRLKNESDSSHGILLRDCEKVCNQCKLTSYNYF